MAYQLLEEPGEMGLSRSPIFFYAYDAELWENDGFYYIAEVYVWTGDAVTDKPSVPTLRLSRYPDAVHGAAFDVSDICNTALDEHLVREAGALFTHGVVWCYVEFGYVDNATGEHLNVLSSDLLPVTKGWSLPLEGVNFDPTLDATLGKNRWLTDRSTRIRIYDGCYFTLALPYKTKDYGVYKVRIWDDNGAAALYDVHSLIGTANNSNERVLAFQCGYGSWLTDPTNLNAKVAFSSLLNPTREYYIQGENAIGGAVTKKFTFEIAPYKLWDFYTVQFLNRYGVWDYLLCEGRKKSRLEVESSEVFRNPLQIDISGVNIQAGRGQYSVDVMAREGFTLNTGWISEQDNELVRQLLLSKRVVCGESPDNGKTYQPLTVKMQGWDEMTQRGDKLINYELTFRLANDYINTIK